MEHYAFLLLIIASLTILIGLLVLNAGLADTRVCCKKFVAFPIPKETYEWTLPNECYVPEGMFEMKMSLEVVDKSFCL